jgi:hypothetical protein
LDDWIVSLPAVPSHYCRAQTERKYLPVEFKNFCNLYRIYKDQVKEGCVKKSTFKQHFITKYNIGIHHPKKDKCSTCEKFKNTPIEFQDAVFFEKEKMHSDERDLTKAKFSADQEKCKNDPEFLVASFDLQKVLNTPHGENMLLYYSRKYSYYNLTVYESATRDGICFCWGEADGKRGANEISTNVHSYLTTVDDRRTVTSLALYCDSCPGQNKNRQMMAMIFFFLQHESRNINEVSINYLLPGHTYMPVDSVHAVIDRNTKRKIIWAPSEWPTIMQNARHSPRPYKIVVQSFDKFRDWKSLQERVLPPSTKKTQEGSAIFYKKVRICTFHKASNLMAVKYSFAENAPVSTVLLQPGERKIMPPQLYRQRLPINKLKYRDLVRLCTNGVIPEVYHEEYRNIPTGNKVPDELAESDEEDGNVSE